MELNFLSVFFAHIKNFNAFKFENQTSFLWFLCLLFLPLIFVLGRIRNKRKVLSLLIRMTCVFILIFTLTTPYLETTTEQKEYLGLIDVSKSIPENALKATIEKFKKLLADKDSKLKLFAYAGKTATESIVLDSSSEVNSIAKELEQKRDGLLAGETNTSQALVSVPSSQSILLATDGFDTSGDLLKTVKNSFNKNRSIFPIFPDSSYFIEEKLLLSSLYAPITVAAGEKAKTKVSIKNTTSTEQTGVLEVWFEDKKIHTEEISVAKNSEKSLEILTPEIEGGLKHLRAVLKSPKGEELSNRHRWISAKEKAKILLLSGNQEDQRVLKDLLKTRGYLAESITADEDKKIPTSFASYSSVILNNIAKDQLPKEFLPNLEEFVKKGGGLLIIGGDKSYGLGKYIDSPLEKISPLKFLPPQTEKRRIKVGVVLVIDKSGSMGENGKLDAAKKAALLSINALKDEDFFSVIGFDHAPFVVLSIRTVAEAKVMAENRLRSLIAAGKTNMLPAVAAARQALKSVDAGRKHIIVLSDGRSEMNTDLFSQELKRIQSEDITLSAVGLGADADIPFMKFLASQGRGSFYSTIDPEKLPQIFIQDIRVASGEKTLVENNSFPVGQGQGGLVSTTIERYPQLKGFVETLPKKGSTLELITKKGSDLFPIMASWDVEKGRVVAFTSDANGRWSDFWVTWPEFVKFWGEVIQSIEDKTNSEAGQVDFDLRYSINAKNIEFELFVYDEKLKTGFAPQVTAQVLVSKDSSIQQSQNIVFNQTKKGVFTSTVENITPGDYKLDIKYGSLNLPPVAVTISPESLGELFGKGINYKHLEELAQFTGGSINPGIEQIQSKTKELVEKKYFTSELILLVFSLLLLEVIIREVGFFALLRRLVYRIF
jgi:Ca-activated chloride channel homolog